ncbi:hypothetical protein SCB49_13885 [unidentified eubacterium SCB49]|nr:hypothetical protein SCB49_13885 [unidentified eubacterium SCB49]
MLQGLSAQNSEFEELGAWYVLSSNSKLSDHWSVQAQTQFRFFELASEIQQFKIRTGAKYKVMDGLSVGLGYAYFKNDFSYLSETPKSFTEQRIVEDIYLSQNLGKAKINHRARLENRFITVNNNTDVLHWFRYLVKVSHPVSTDFTIDLYNEIWLHLQEPIFAQNWLGAGVSYKINELLKARAGYQKIHLTGPDFDRLIFELNFNLDFSTVEKTV